MKPGYATAASFVLGVLITSAALVRQDTNSTVPFDDSVPSEVFPLFSTRSDNNVQPIPVRPETIAVLLVDVPDTGLKFNVSVRRAVDAEIVWSQAALSAGYLDTVAVGIPAELLPPDLYTLAIESTDQDADYSQEIAFETVDQ